MRFPSLTCSEGLIISDRKMIHRTTDDAFRFPLLSFVEINNWDVAGCPTFSGCVSTEILQHCVRHNTESRRKSISREENAT